MDYKIIKLSTDAGVIWTKNQDNDLFTRTSGGNRRNVNKGILDFLFSEDVTILQVKRLSDNIIFDLEESSLNINGQQVNIETFDITQNKIEIHLVDGEVKTLEEAVKYVAPVRVPRSTNTTNNSFNSIKTTIETNNPREVRILGVLKRRSETLKEFLVRFFTEFNLEKETIFVDDRSVQTGSGRRRSLGDIYMICKYYYPNITLKELIQLLYVDLFEEIDGFRSSYCSTINKRVWYYTENAVNEMLNKTQNDEYNKPHRFYIDNLN